ncbi:MAG TPA: alanine racemase [Candidatus Paceibacterota bacterium]|nr:alanine racemase [Candidatus Paceibacterota bacterium]
MTNNTKQQLNGLRTWIEIDSRAARRNYDTFRKLIGRKTKLWSVVKSNAYGHGLMVFSKLVQEFGVDGFCVDSLVEGLRLRKEGIRKPILVLGPTLPALYKEAAKRKITITISNFDALKALAREKQIPDFHIKIDTGMHRQGFYLDGLPKAIKEISRSKFLISKLKGIYTHFASAKDVNYPTYTEKQFAEFERAAALFKKAGFTNLVKHAAATGGALVNPKYHLDAVRIGIGLYGLWPSKELEVQLGGELTLHPVLSWRAVVCEVKKIKTGDYIGYDLSERAPKDMQMAIVPVGYWHGFPRALSSGAGTMTVRGKRARVLGKVSMDLTAIATVGGVCAAGDTATLVGKDGSEEISAAEAAARAGTIHYEFLTRLNPLIERILR